MPDEYRDAITHIEEAIAEFGGSYSKWYVGIASDGRTRLDEHSVQDEPWATYRTSNARTARDIEAYFLDRRRTAGGKSGGDDKTRTVYAYRTSTTTRQ